MKITLEIAAHADVGVSHFLRARFRGKSRKAVLVAVSDPALAAILLFNIPQEFATAPVSADLSTHESHTILHRLRPGVIVTDALRSDLVVAANAAGIPVAIASLKAGPSDPRIKMELASASFDEAVGRDYPPDIALILQTSGTTGAPKIVGLSRSALRTSTANTIANLELSNVDRTLLVMPLTHIHGIVAVLHATLRSGGILVALPARDPIAFWSAYQRSDATWFSTVPSLLQAICETRPAAVSAHSKALKFIRTASSALPASLRAVAEALFEVPIIEAYGMTEACHQVTSNSLRENRAGSVGRPGRIPQIAILTGNGARVRDGATGEICIKGANVFAGYLSSNDERPRPRWQQVLMPGRRATHWGRWFRTGDLGRIDNDGYLWISGRIKEQINRGGETLSPVEIEEALLSLPMVREAAAFPLPHPSLGEEVAAVCVADNTTEAEISDRLTALLSFAKLPKKIFLESSIPKASSGKVSRAALGQFYRAQDPFGAGGGLRQTSVQPNLPSHLSAQPQSSRSTSITVEAVTRKLDEIFRDILGVAIAARATSFFELGGTSLKALEVMSAVRREFEVSLPISSIVTHPTISLLATLIVKSASETGETAYAGVEPEKIPTASALSLPASLVDFCVANAMDGSRDDLRQKFVIKLAGGVSPADVERALAEMVALHPALRAAIVRQTDTLSLAIVRNCRIAIAVFDDVVDRWSDSLALLAFFRQPIELDRAPLIRVAAQALREEGYAVAFEVPEIILDGYARTAFLVELADRLARKPVVRKDSFVEISRRMPLRPTTTAAREVYRAPADLNRLRGTSSATVSKAIEPEAWKHLSHLAAKWGVTPYSVQLTLFASILARIAGGPVPVAISIQCRREADEFFTLGNFSTRMPFLLDADPTDRVVEVVRATASALFSWLERPEHQAAAFNDDICMFDYEDEVETLGGFLGSERDPVFARLDAMRIELIESPARSLSLGLKITPPTHNILSGRATLTYDSGRFSSGRANAIVDAFLDSILSLEAETEAKLAALPLAATARPVQHDAEIRNKSLEAFNPEVTRLDDLFADIVRRWPDRPAIAFPGGKLSFVELDRFSSDLAQALKRFGLASGTAVAFWEGDYVSSLNEGVVCTWCYPIAALGILKSGAAVVPVAHQVPGQIALTMLQDTAACVIVAAAATLPKELSSSFRPAGSVPTAAGALHLFSRTTGLGDTRNAPSTLVEAAYVMFTSGTTGAPKGIVQSHVSVIDLARGTLATGIWPDGNALPGPNIGFDVFTGVTWLTWVLGRTVHFRGEYELTAAAFAELQHSGVKSFITSPTTVAAMIERDETILRGFELVVLTGEALPHATAERLLRTGDCVRFVNLYGPTETTIWASWHLLSEPIGPNIPIGVALEGYALEVCEPRSLARMPTNLPGEILIAPRRGMVGYLDERLNRGRFVDRMSATGEIKRFYRSGDIGWLGDDGNLYYVGRQDRQVQVAGVRVELGGVEEVIAALPEVTQVAVVDVSSPTGTYLAAFIVPAVGAHDVENLRLAVARACHTSLPRSAIPGTVRIVSELPSSAVGKVDYDELRTSVLGALQATGSRTKPRPGTVDETIAVMWKRILGRSEILLEDDFKDLGGTSLGVLLLSGALSDKFEIRVSVSELFLNPTLSAQVRLVQGLLDRQALRNTEFSTSPGVYLRRATARALDPLVRIVEPMKEGEASDHIPVFVGLPAGGGWTGAGVHLSRSLTFRHVVKITEYTGRGHQHYDDRRWLEIASAIFAELVGSIPSNACLVGASLGGWLAWLVERTWVAETGKAGPRVINIDGGMLHTLKRPELGELPTSDAFKSLLSRANEVAGPDMLILKRESGPRVPFVNKLGWESLDGRVVFAPEVRTLLHGEMPIEPMAAFAPYVESWIRGDTGAGWPSFLEPQHDSIGQKLYRAFAQPLDGFSPLYEDMKTMILGNAQYDQASEIFEMLALLVGDVHTYLELARRHYLGWPTDRFAVAKQIALSEPRKAQLLNSKWLADHPGDNLVLAIREILKAETRSTGNTSERIGQLRYDLSSWLYALSRSKDFQVVL